MSCMPNFSLSLGPSFQTVEVYSVTVGCTVTSRFAHTVVTSKALNKANTSQEIFFEMELPKTAFITNFSMEIDGQVYVGEVKEKEKAKKEYEKAVSSGQTAGLVKASGRKMEKFSVSVNIAAKSSVTFILTYEELLQRKLGQYEILTRVTPKQRVQEFQIVADIYEPQGFAFVEATATFLTNDLLSLVEKTVTDTKAHVSFSPTLEQQRKCPGCEGTVIDGDFIIKYDVKRETNLGDVQIVNGYFVHFFAPPDLPRVPKNVVFVIDRSGSMSGRKIQQTRDALEAILKDLHEEDHFALILFDSSIFTWKDSLTKATEENVSEAIAYVRELRDRGATNINGAVLRAVRMLVEDRENDKLPERSVDMIILLTDGMPNNGESNLQTIQENVHSAVGGKMTMFCLGFGNDVDYSFLDVLCRQNKGLARRIFEGSDATLQLQGFYDEVSSPLLLDVDLRYPDNAVDHLTKNHYSQLFNGSEIVVSGRLINDFRAQGKASMVNLEVSYPKQEYIFGNFSERLWAYLTIQQLLAKRFDHLNCQEKDTATAKALNMALRYTFVTPLTSMVVTKPETEDGPDSPLIADKLTEETLHTKMLCSTYEFNCNDAYAVDGDPHFMIELPERDDALCFNVNDKPGTIFNLVRDPKSGFVVNGQIIGKKKVVQDANTNTYFGRLGIIHQKLGVRLEVTLLEAVLMVRNCAERLQGPISWLLAVVLSVDFSLTKNCCLTVTLRHSVKFMVIRHKKVWKRRREHQDYLGFYTLDSHHLSASVHGLLGQFYHGVEFEVTDLRPGELQKNLDATMYVKGQTLNVTRHWQKDFSSHVKDGENIPCWFVNNDGTGLIDGGASDYVVSELFNTAF
uniref:Inter-alpha-trypsin inhibitor heavy chain H3 n=1 Tax=Dicentrarchus labrax TaxID=13489 RepID=A0A8C4HT13_DICLA